MFAQQFKPRFQIGAVGWRRFKIQNDATEGDQQMQSIDQFKKQTGGAPTLEGLGTINGSEISMCQEFVMDYLSVNPSGNISGVQEIVAEIACMTLNTESSQWDNVLASVLVVRPGSCWLKDKKQAGWTI